MLAIFQSTLGHRYMMNPVGGNIYQINILALAQNLVAIITEIHFCLRHIRFLEITVATLGTFALIITQGNNTHAVDMRPTLHSTRTAHTEADKSHTHYRQRGCT